MPDHEKIKEHKHLRFLGPLLHDPNLLHLNRRSVSGAFAVGLFNAWVPVPFQMILSAVASIIFKVNLPLSVGLVWITNPLTMAPMFYFAYWLGSQILPRPDGHEFHFELSWDWMVNSLGQIWEPFLLGCSILAVTSSITSYFLIRLLWHWHVVKAWQARKDRDLSRD